MAFSFDDEDLNNYKQASGSYFGGGGGVPGLASSSTSAPASATQGYAATQGTQQPAQTPQAPQAPAAPASATQGYAANSGTQAPAQTSKAQSAPSSPGGFAGWGQSNVGQLAGGTEYNRQVPTQSARPAPATGQATPGYVQGGGNPEGTAMAPTSGGSPTDFVNFANYFYANQGAAQREGQQVEQKIKNDAQGAETAAQQAADQFEQGAEKGAAHSSNQPGIGGNTGSQFAGMNRGTPSAAYTGNPGTFFDPRSTSELGGSTSPGTASGKKGATFGQSSGGQTLTPVGGGGSATQNTGMASSRDDDRSRGAANRVKEINDASLSDNAGGGGIAGYPAGYSGATNDPNQTSPTNVGYSGPSNDQFQNQWQTLNENAVKAQGELDDTKDSAGLADYLGQGDHNADYTQGMNRFDAAMVNQAEGSQLAADRTQFGNVGDSLNNYFNTAENIYGEAQDPANYDRLNDLYGQSQNDPNAAMAQAGYVTGGSTGANPYNPTGSSVQTGGGHGDQPGDETDSHGRPINKHKRQGSA